MNPVAFISYVVAILLYVAVIYVFPWKLDPEIFGAFDSHSYAFRLLNDLDQARIDQPFLNFYYAGFSSSEYFHYFAAALHSVLLLPLFLCVRGDSFSAIRRAIYCVVLFPEFIIFFSTVSKEGLAIIGSLAFSLSVVMFSAERLVRGVGLFLYGVGLFEASRPGFSIIPVGAMVMALILPICGVSRPFRNALIFLLFGVLLGSVAIYGPSAELVADLYERGRDYLIWFEDNMGSDSIIKSLARTTFSLPFSTERPGVVTSVIVVFASVLKSVFYGFALPILSLPRFDNPVPQVWAISWQIAATVTSLILLASFVFFRKHSVDTTPWRVGASFGVYFIYIVAASTFIFHVRYRAPAVAALLFFVFIYRPVRYELLFVLNVIVLFCAFMVPWVYAGLV